MNLNAPNQQSCSHDDYQLITAFDQQHLADFCPPISSVFSFHPASAFEERSQCKNAIRYCSLYYLPEFL